MPLFQGVNKLPIIRPPASDSSENETGRPGSMKRLSHMEGSRSPEDVSPVRMSLLSRLRSGTGGSGGSTETTSSHPLKAKENAEHNDVPLAVDIQIPKDESDNHRDSDASPSPLSSSPPSFMGEPKQPTNIHDAMEMALNTTEKPKGDQSGHSHKHPHNISHLTKWDLKHFFSGAPHFILEKGRNDYWYPQVLFPWDLHVTMIQDLWDTQPLMHPSFTLSTLHAHLPVPDEWSKKGHTMMWKTDRRNSDVIRRASFDVGVFEFPNMISMNGKEPGSVGFRHFLELPVADNKKYKGPPVPKGNDFQRLAALPVSEAFHIMEHLSSPYSECNNDIVHDRHKLLMEGPPGWKRIGVRDFTIESVVNRLQELSKIRHEILVERSAKTVLDRQSTRTLYDNLFTKFLYPPTRTFEHLDRHSLKTQIEVLTEVLATKGAWFDFSLTEWRMRIGQILWEMPPHPDGDFLGTKDCPPDHYRVFSERGLDRKWFLLQMLLAAELLIRVDAVVRVGILEESKDIILTIQDIERFDKLRSGKVDWDLILVRRFFDNVDVQHYQHFPAQHEEGQVPPRDRPAGRHGLLSRIGSHKHRDALVTSADPESAWDYVLVPRHPEKQLQGLFIFAQSIEWPGADELREKLSSKFKSGDSSTDTASIYASPVHNTLPERYVQTLDKSEMYRKSQSRRLLLLQWPRNGGKDGSYEHDVGGWMSRTWLSGLVLPGEAIGHFLIATVLENDPKAMKALGPLANLYGGFVYDDRSWWSKMSVVGRVLSCLDKTTGCMGWIKSHVVPRDVHTGELLGDTWLEVETREVPQKSRKPRIQHGTQLALQSTPLGIGALSSDTFSLPVDQPVTDTTAITLEGLFLSRKPEQETMQNGITVAKKAYVAFRLMDVAASKATILSFPLTYNTHFVSSYACLPPHGYATNSRNPFLDKTSIQQHKPTSGRSEHATADRLPGHPLHMSYPYRYIPLRSLADIGASALPSRYSNNKNKNKNNNNNNIKNKSSESPFSETWILDARGEKDREAFARAWCASVGTSAVISRVGRTCLACSIREARAVDVGIVIRVGD
ncbi:hypothetical protein DTO212C5_7944 [Paecilomyces variotii]|nr:hypothetical protein DTO212C5_7944 [Paecilomyces variotii]KAJ9405808.1 hypothetical protein DTO045G8_6471 [Paecilomyces variotii]